MKPWVRNLGIAIGAWALWGCCTEPSLQKSLENVWVEPVPGMPEMKQGFILESGGKASSVNMASLVYQSWKLQGDTLILTGKSIGNHQTLPFEESFEIKQATDQVLALRDVESGLSRHFSKARSGDIKFISEN